MRIIIDIEECADGDGIDLQIGDMIYRNVSGLNAERLAHEEIRNAIDTIADAQSQLKPDEPDYETEEDRYSGTPDHRWPA